MCENGATCVQAGHLYQCVCAPGWSGKLCDVEMVSCKDASIRKGKISLILYFSFLISEFIFYHFIIKPKPDLLSLIQLRRR